MKPQTEPENQIIIRELGSSFEFDAAEQLQLEVWGRDTIPESRELLQAMQECGGLVAGAFAPDGKMVGFLWGFPTCDPTVQHSHRLAVQGSWRGRGIGARMKWFQRDWCLNRGITLVQWTVDPLRASNAELNVRHLGATSATYLVDYYGEMRGIDAGAPSDRLLMDWHLDHPDVAALALQTPEDCGFPEAQEANHAHAGRPHDARPDPEARQLLLRLPLDFVRLAAQDRALAILWRLHTRELFERYFARGFAITGFTRVEGPTYLLER
jgi:chorismate synthase